MFPFGFLAFVAAVVCFAEDRREGFREAWAQLFVVGDVEPCVEGLVREPPIGVAGVRVGVMRVGEEPQTIVEERPASRVFLVVFTEALLDVREAGADAVLVPFQCG
ncbi:MAG TPA: hypothetical protein VFC82_08860 [Actinomycetaceae bacterium]|nr:hypothetical protein [Actinomycetaceae bacterium]